MACDTGYHGGGEVTCEFNNDYAFNTANVTCITLPVCGEPIRQRGYVFEPSGAGGAINSTLTSRCATGYQGNPSNITCQTNGSWTTAYGCETITFDCTNQIVTTILNSRDVEATCDGVCVDSAHGTTCTCGAELTEACYNL